MACAGLILGDGASVVNLQAVLLSLYAIRSQVDALIAQLDPQDAQAAVATGVCPHPADKQIDTSTAGDGPRRVFCLACNKERDA